MGTWRYLGRLVASGLPIRWSTDPRERSVPTRLFSRLALRERFIPGGLSMPLDPRRSPTRCSTRTLLSYRLPARDDRRGPPCTCLVRRSVGSFEFVGIETICQANDENLLPPHPIRQLQGDLPSDIVLLPAGLRRQVAVEQAFPLRLGRQSIVADPNELAVLDVPFPRHRPPRSDDLEASWIQVDARVGYFLP